MIINNSKKLNNNKSPTNKNTKKNKISNNNNVLNVIYGVETYKTPENMKKDLTYHGDKKECLCLNYSKNSKGDYIYDKHGFDKCSNKATTKDGFCEAHKDCFNFMKLFTNGYEPEYEPTKWNNDNYVNGSHNCYSYFLNENPSQALTIKCQEICEDDKDCPDSTNECQDLIPQPGDSSLIEINGSPDMKTRKYTCPTMIKKLKADNPDIKHINFTMKCPSNYYKGAMVVDYLNTFHFYRLNGDGRWSHKPGITEVKTIDALGKEIVIPHFAARNYKRDGNSHINYTDFCGYFCIPKDNEKAKYMA